MMGIFAFGVIIGVPVAFALGIGAVSAFYFEGLPLLIAFQRIRSGINVFSLLAIPFFIFAGELMFHGGIAVRLVRFGYVMMVYSYKLAVFKWTTQIPLIHIPEGLRAVPIMICGALILLFSIGHILNYKNKITDNNNSE